MKKIVLGASQLNNTSARHPLKATGRIILNTHKGLNFMHKNTHKVIRNKIEYKIPPKIFGSIRKVRSITDPEDPLIRIRKAQRYSQLILNSTKKHPEQLLVSLNLCNSFRSKDSFIPKRISSEIDDSFNSSFTKQILDSYLSL